MEIFAYYRDKVEIFNLRQEKERGTLFGVCLGENGSIFFIDSYPLVAQLQLTLF